MKGEAIGGLVPGGGGELEFPGVGGGCHLGNDELTGAEGALVGSGIAGPVKETGGVHDPPAGITEVQQDGRVGEDPFSGRPVGVFRHPAAEKGLGGGEIIVREWVARQVAESERSEPAAEVEGTPEQEGRSRCAVPLEEGGRACLAEAEEGSPGGGQADEGEVLRITEVTPESKVSRSQVADAYRVDAMEARRAVGDGRDREPAVSAGRIGGLEDLPHRGIASARPPGIGTEGGGEVDKEAASIGIGPVVLHEHGVGPAAGPGEVVPDGPPGSVVATPGTGATRDLGAGGEGVEGEPIVERGLAHLSARAVHPWDESLGQSDEIGGGMGGIILVELDREATELLVLQGDLEVGQDLGLGRTAESQQKQEGSWAWHRGRLVESCSAGMFPGGMGVGYLETTIRRRAVLVAGEEMEESSMLSCQVLPRSVRVMTGLAVVPSAVRQKVVHASPSRELCTS